MKKSVDEVVGRSFMMAAGILMTAVFPKAVQPNRRRLAFACGPASPPGRPSPLSHHPKFDLVGLGLVPGREWKGPREIFVAEEREGEMLLWSNCSFWTDRPDAPLYILTEDPNVFFSYDGYALLPLSHAPTDRRAGERLASARLRTAARRVPTDVECNRMM